MSGAIVEELEADDVHLSVSFPKTKGENTMRVAEERFSIVDSLMFDTTDFSHNYLIKTAMLCKSMNEIGFGRYQYGLFFVAGFGWFVDNAWPVTTSLMIPVLRETDGIHPPRGKGPYLGLAQNLGLLVGAAVWSLSSDVIGRRWPFNLSFLITGVWAVVAGSAPNFGTLSVFVSLWSVGVGGNLPVDSALFLEALPSTHQWLLTMMSGWWALGQLAANLIAWGLIGNYSCDTHSETCLKADNKGWRYFLFTMGGLTLLFFIARFCFPVFESPRFYVACGRDDLAIETLKKIAKINGTEVSLTLEALQKVDEQFPEENVVKNRLFNDKIQKFNAEHIQNSYVNDTCD
ncbi:hypothetical protein PSN45_004761 [Yamadazyma tenuis]|uniref:uncharacterized protein n=1 Tax=Candida tenuis TaxID=2315449 RepID=UPI0027AA9235|nr:hypothetical protein PSN45_004761 [Yamadazyma tenuis]